MATQIYLGLPPPNVVKWIKENYKPEEPEVDMLNVPLTFTAKEPNSNVTFNIGAGEYVTSFDGQTWNDYTSGTEINLLNINDKVMFRAKTQNDTCFNEYNEGTNSRFILTGKIAATGNIQFLLDSTGERLDVPEYCFGMLFGAYGEETTPLLTTPVLPATTLGDWCYTNMFQGCSLLTQAPALPATNLATGCYADMLYRCTNIPEPKFNMSHMTFDEVANEIQNTLIFGEEGTSCEVQCSDKILVATYDDNNWEWTITEK